MIALGGFQRNLVNLVTIGAAQMVRRVRTADPVAGLFIFGVTTQTDTIGLIGSVLAEDDNLGDVATAVHVQAAVAVTLFALNALLGVKGVRVIFGDGIVAVGARIHTDRFSAGDFDILRVRRDGWRGFLIGSGGGNAEKSEEAKDQKTERRPEWVRHGQAPSFRHGAAHGAVRCE